LLAEQGLFIRLKLSRSTHGFAALPNISAQETELAVSHTQISGG
jgi:hypothetical protein